MDKHVTDALTAYLPYITLSLVIIALVLISILFNKTAALLKRIRDNRGNKGLVLSQSGNTQRDPFDYSRVTALEKSIQELKQQIKTLTKTPEPIVVAEVVVEPVPQASTEESALSPKDEDLTYYSKFPDLDNGFTESSLMTKQNGEQIYVLILTPEQGTGIFYISESSEVQKYALSDVNFYLPKGCHFINQPGKSTGIKTAYTGTLIKSGDSWLIDEKVKIEFV